MANSLKRRGNWHLFRYRLPTVLPLLALLGLLFSPPAYAQTKYAAGFLRDNVGVTEGETLSVKLRLQARILGLNPEDTIPAGAIFNIRYEIKDDPNFNVLDSKQEGSKEYRFRTNKELKNFPQILFEERTITIKTVADPTTCRDAEISITLLPDPNNSVAGAFSHGTMNKSITVPVKKHQDADCPVVSIGDPQRIAANGIKEGGSANFQLKVTDRGNANRDISVKWKADDDGTYDFLHPEDERIKKQRFNGNLNSRTHPIQIDTQTDHRSGDGKVTLKLLESDSYRLGSPHQVQFAVKEDNSDLARKLTVDAEVTLPKQRAVHPLKLTLSSLPTGSAKASVRVRPATAQEARDQCKVTTSSSLQNLQTSFGTFTWTASDGEVGKVKNFRILIVPDEDHEGNENICLVLDKPRNLTLPGNTSKHYVKVTIIDFPPPVITVSGASVNESEGKLEFEVEIASLPPAGVTAEVNYADAGTGTATSKGGAKDYEPISPGTLTFTSNESEYADSYLKAMPKRYVKKLSIPVINDEIVENNETIILRFRRPVNAKFSGSRRNLFATGTILNDDSGQVGAQEVRIRHAQRGAPYEVHASEGETVVLHADFYVRKGGKWQKGTAATDFNFRWESRSGSALPTLDYDATALKSTDTIPAGESSVERRIRIKKDSLDESVETIQYVATYSSGSARLEGTQANIKIHDNNLVRIKAPKKATEGNPLKFPVRLAVPAAADFSVNWQTESLAAHTAQPGKDYTAASGTLTFKAGETVQYIVVSTLQDAEDESDETMSVVLALPQIAGVSIDSRHSRAVGLIRDNDTRPSVKIKDQTVTEGEKVTLTAKLSRAAQRPVHLEWWIRTPLENGAARGADYVSGPKGNITIAAGDTSATIEFTTIDDDEDEPEETFDVALVILSQPPGNVDLFFSGTRTEDALGDSTPNILAERTATVKILDNDLPLVTVEDVTLTEGKEGKATFNIRLSRSQEEEVSVYYKTQTDLTTGSFNRAEPIVKRNGRYSYGDYAAIEQKLRAVFKPGISLVAVDIEIADDEEGENTETFKFVLSHSDPTDPEVRIGRGAAIGTIKDDDGIKLWISSKQRTIREGETITVRIRRNRVFDNAGSFTIHSCLNPTYDPTKGAAPKGHATLTGREKNNGDDVAVSKTSGIATPCKAPGESFAKSITFPAGSLETSTEIVTWQDNAVEGNETFEMFAVALPSFRFTDINDFRQIFTIIDDDSHNLRVESANSPWEGRRLKFEVFANVENQAQFNTFMAAVRALGTNNKFGYQLGSSTDTAKAGTHFDQPAKMTFSLDTSVTDFIQPLATIRIDTIDNDKQDGDKTLTLSLDALPASFAAYPKPATGTVRDDDAFRIEVADAVVDEGDTAQVQVKFHPPSLQDVTINWKTVPGTAAVPNDFTAVADGTAVLKAGKTKLRLPVATTEDDTYEENERFQVKITGTNLPGQPFIARHTGTVVIRDDDLRTLTISGYADAAVDENSTWSSPAPSWDGEAEGDVTWTIEGDDAKHFSIDPDSGILTFAAQNFESPADKNTDSAYAVTVRVTDEDGTTGTAELTATVTDVIYGRVELRTVLRTAEGDPVPGAFRFTATGAKGDQQARPQTVEVSWNLAGLGGSGAASASDIALSNSGGPRSLQFNASASTAAELAKTTDDNLSEGVETFGIEFETSSDDVLLYDANASAASTDNRMRVNYSLDDDHTAEILLSPTSLELNEADDTSTAGVKENEKSYSVSLNFQPATASLTVNLSTDPATTRFTLDKTSVTFTPEDWNTPQTVTVTAVDDAVKNAALNEAIDIDHAVSGAGGFNIDSKAVTVTVADDDYDNVLSIAAPAVEEGAAPAKKTMTFTLTLSKPAGKDFKVSYSSPCQTNDGSGVCTAKSTRGGETMPDFEDFGSGEILFKRNETSKTLEVVVLGDIRHEGNEDIAIQFIADDASISFASGLRAGTAAGSAIALGTITDDDAEPSIQILLTDHSNKPIKEFDEKFYWDNNIRHMEIKLIKVTLKLVGGTTFGADTTVKLHFGKTDDTATYGKDYRIFEYKHGCGEHNLPNCPPPPAGWTTVAQIQPFDLVIKEGVLEIATNTGWFDAKRPRITIGILDDTIEEDTEELTFWAQAGEINVMPATVKIKGPNDEKGEPYVSMTKAVKNVKEGDQPDVSTDMIFTVTLSHATRKTVTVPYFFRNYSWRYGYGVATGGEDYKIPDPRSIEIAPGETTGTIIIPIFGDARDEPDEHVLVLIGQNIINGKRRYRSDENSGSYGIGKIIDDDDTPTHITLSAAPAKIDENISQPPEITVTAAFAGGTTYYNDTTVNVSVGKSGDVAVAGTDYTKVSNFSIVIPKGEASSTKTFTFTPTNDTIDEINESVSVFGNATSRAFHPDDTNYQEAEEDFDFKVVGTELIIVDDDTPIVAVNSPSAAVTEGHRTDETTDMTFTVTVSPVGREKITVPYTLSGTATGGTDYTQPNPLSIEIKPGESSGTITIPVAGDIMDEPDETVIVTLGEIVNGELSSEEGAGVAQGVITDDDAPPAGITLSAAPAAVAENADDPADITVTAAVTGGTAYSTDTAITVSVGESGDPAESGTDYGAVADFTIVVPSGATSHTGTFSLAPVDDTIDEDDETISVTGASGGIQITDTQVSILDDDAATAKVSVTGPSAAIDEGDKPDAKTEMTFTVSVAPVSARTITVPYTLSGTAKAGSDYVEKASGTITIKPGVDRGTIVVSVKGDEIYELDETVEVALGVPTNATVASNGGAASGIIKNDDDAPLFGFSTGRHSVNEGDGTATVTIRRVGETELTATMSFITAGNGFRRDAESPEDFSIKGDGGVSFPPDKTEMELEFEIKDDDLIEQNEQFKIQFGNTIQHGRIPSNESAVVEIQDNDKPVLTLAPTSRLTMTEGDAASYAEVTLSLSKAIGKADAERPSYIEVELLLSSATGTVIAESRAASRDFILSVHGSGVSLSAQNTTNPIIRFSKGDQSSEVKSARLRFTATDRDDSDYEDDDLVVQIEDVDYGFSISKAPVASDDGDAQTEDNLVRMKLIDDDEPTVAVADAAAVTEGNDPETTVDMSFTVTLSGKASKDVTVPYTLSGSATAGDDYSAPNPQSIVIAAGSTEGTISIPVKGDLLDEADETIVVSLQSPTNASISTVAGAGSGTGEITDDDLVSSKVSVANAASVTEGNDSSATTDMTFTVTLSPVSGRDVKVPFSLAGEAAATADYTVPNPLSVTISAGDSSGKITVPIRGDLIDEKDETVIVNLGAPDFAVIDSAEGAGTGTGLITDDDTTKVVLTTPDNSATEGDAKATAEIMLTVSRGLVAGESLAVPLILSGATLGTEFTLALKGTPAGVTFKASTGVVTFTGPAVDDSFKATVAKASVVLTAAEDDDATSETIAVSIPASSRGNAPVLTAVGLGNGVAGSGSGEINLTDDDTRGVTVSKAALTVAEADDTGTDKDDRQEKYTVVLDSAPSGGAVTVDVASADESIATVSPAELEFTAGTWNVPQTVTVTGVNDDVDNKDNQREVRVTHALDAGGTDYAAVTADYAAVTVTDDDAAPSGITLTVDPASVDEGAGATAVTVTAAVGGGTTYAAATVVTVSVGAEGDSAAEAADYAAVAGFDITVAAGQSSGSGQFTLTPADDDLDEANETVTVAGVSGALKVTPAQVTIADDDTRGVTVSKAALTVAEADDTGTDKDDRQEKYTVVLDSAPSGGAVTVDVASADESIATVSPAELEFTAGTWNVPQTVTVTGVNDDVDNKDNQREVRVTHALDAGGTDYAAVTADYAAVTVTDDDAAPSGITLTVDPASVDEGAGATAVTVTAAVGGGTTYAAATVVTVSVGAEGDSAAEAADYAAVAGFDITVAAGQSSGSGQFTLTPADDDLDEANETVTVAGVSGALKVTPAQVTIADDDTRGVTVSKAALTVAEADDTGTDKDDRQEKYTVVLDSAPSGGAVTVDVASADESIATVSPAELEFTAGTWNVPQTVTVTGVNDDVDNKDNQREVRVTHALDAGGTDYAAVTADYAAVTVTDDDAAPSGITLTVDPASVDEGAGATAVTVTAAVGGGTTYAAATVVTVSVGAEGDSAAEAADYAAVAGFDITVAAGQSSGSGQFTLTPADDDLDEANETVTGPHQDRHPPA